MKRPLPFRDYPGGGRKLIGARRGANCRHEYGREFMHKTGQHRCAYCGIDLTASYENWLTMTLDHVVPVSVGKALEIPKEWLEDYSNAVLACAACNTFANHYRPDRSVSAPQSFLAFFALRDRIFAERHKLIAEVRREERRYFDSRPWEGPRARQPSSSGSDV